MISLRKNKPRTNTQKNKKNDEIKNNDRIVIISIKENINTNLNP
jgi:hypothetical protein